MENINVIKSSIIVFFAFITAKLGVMAVPVYIMVCTNVIDYVSGILAAPKRGQKINSSVAYGGIVKKVSMWILVVVGWLVDELLNYMAMQFGTNISIGFFVAAIVAVWITINEFISILENLKDLGAPVPSFLEKMMKYLKSEVEELTGDDDSEKDN